MLCRQSYRNDPHLVDEGNMFERIAIERSTSSSRTHRTASRELDLLRIERNSFAGDKIATLDL